MPRKGKALKVCRTFYLVLYSRVGSYIGAFDCLLCFAAQDLLDSWLHEKKHGDFNLEVQFKEEKWAQRSKPLEEVARNSVTRDRYGDDLLQSHDWTSMNSYDNSSPSLNIMGKTFCYTYQRK